MHIERIREMPKSTTSSRRLLELSIKSELKPSGNLSELRNHQSFEKNYALLNRSKPHSNNSLQRVLENSGGLPR